MQIHLGMDIHQTNCPKRHKGALGGFRGSNIQKSREAVKRLDRLAPTLVHVGGFIWEYKYKSPLNTPGGMVGGGGVGVTNSKVLGSCQTAGPIGTKFGTRLWIHLGMDIG